MKFFLNCLHFVSKTFIYDKTYEEMIKAICKVAVKRSELKQLNCSTYMSSFIRNLFNDDSVNISAKTIIYDGNEKSDNLSMCKKNNFSLFFIKNNIISEMFNSKEMKKISIDYFSYFKKSVDVFVECKEEFKQLEPNIYDEITNLRKILTFNNHDIIRIFNLKNIKNHRCKELRGIILNLKKTITKLKAKFTINNYISQKLATKLKELDRSFDILHEIVSVLQIIDYVEINSRNRELLNRNIDYGVETIPVIQPFIYLSKDGVLNFGIVSSQICLIDKIILKYKSLEYAASICGNSVCSQNETLASIFKLTKFNEENKKFSLCNELEVYSTIEPTKKATYMNFIYDTKYINDDKTKLGNVAKKFFDYVSLYVPFHHEYNNIYLWKYATKQISENVYIGEDDARTNHKDNDNIIKDYGNLDTIHFYICDNTIVYSIINSEYLKESNQYLYITLKVNDISHKSKIYSKWYFSNICESLLFGSMAKVCFKMLALVHTNEMSKHKLNIIKMHIYHQMIKISTDILVKYNPYLFSAKSDSTNISEIIFNELKLVQAYNSLNDFIDNGWKDGNLITSKVYSRFTLKMTLVSILITLFNFGIISVGYLLNYNNNEENFYYSQRSIRPLLFNLIEEDKLNPIFILSIIFIIFFMPSIFLLIISFVEYIKTKKFMLAKKYIKIKKS